LGINLFAGLIIFMFGYFWPRIPKSMRAFRLRQFFGPSVLSTRFAVVYGTLQDPRPRYDDGGNPLMRFQKRTRSGRRVDISGPFENIVGDCEIRATSYLVQSIGKERDEMVGILSDEKAYDDLDYTLIALGSDSSNEISAFALREPANKFLFFRQEGTQTFIERIADKTRYVGFQPPTLKDYGIILRLRSERFPMQSFFVCAGLGEWGTSGAAWYLATYWESLYKEFRQRDFGIVVEVDIGSDKSAKRVS
jgi:hypothetical protein